VSALTVDHDPDSDHDHEWDELVRVWEETDGPEGSRVEIIEGLVTVAPPPANTHNDVADRVHRRLYAAIPEDWGVYQTQGVAVPSRGGLYVPDLVVAPRAAVREPGHYIPAAAVELAVEITWWSDAKNDRTAKYAGYAHAGVPLYLLIDAHAPGGPTITLYGEPTGGVYRTLHAEKWGEPIRLPEPFGITLDTSEFPGS